LELIHLPLCGDQLLKLPLGQLLFFVDQLLLLRSQGVFLKGDGELMVEEIHARPPQALILRLHGSLVSIKVGSMGCEIDVLTFEHAGDLFFLLLWLSLPLSHLLLSLGDGIHTPVEVLL
jgi:hypothetical protein